MGDDDQALRTAPAKPPARRLRAQPARSQASEWTRTNAGERSDAERG
jgi:hypothetical protein